jgi:hypothetical protein
LFLGKNLCHRKIGKIAEISDYNIDPGTKPIVLFERHCHATEKSEAIAHCMCKEMPVIPVNKVVDRKE